MRKLLMVTTALLALSGGAQAAIVANLGVNPNSATGDFSNGNLPTGAFDDQYTFQLVGGPTFFTVGSATNVYPNPTDFIANFTGSVFEIVGAVGGGDDLLVLGPATATPGNCGANCQVFGGSALLDAGSYYLNISGVAGATAGYGGNLSTTQVGAIPEPATWAMMLLGFAGMGFMAYRKKTTFRLA
jgi:PEP-CTERM motif